MISRARSGTARLALPRGWSRDVAAATVLTLFLLLSSGHNRPPTGGHRADAAAYLLLVLAGVSVALCRRFPAAALVMVTAVLGCYLGRGYPNGPIYLAGMAVLFSLGWHTSRRRAAAGTAALVVALSVVAATTRDAGLTVLPLIFLGWATAAVLLGDAARNRRIHVDSARAQARSRARAEAERARRRTAEDRLHIARDLHDSVGHAMAMINVQAAAGAHVADQRPDAAKQALVAIQHASGDVLDELTAMLRVLRSDGESADRAPSPGLAQIRQLTQGSASANLRTSIIMEGPIADVPDAVGLAAYRIVQESLTNVIRHARAGQARVRVCARTGGGLQVEVCDDGPGAASSAPSVTPSVGSGIGIRGMRERAESSGGTLHAGPGPDGGFLVRAEWRSTP